MGVGNLVRVSRSVIMGLSKDCSKDHCHFDIDIETVSILGTETNR